FTTASVGIHDLAMSARRSLTRGIGELLRLLDPGLSDLVRTPHFYNLMTLSPRNNKKALLLQGL
ncbi:hypothetical protein, partial [Aeromonas veronii]|uniref:hypothetical protein n=1 Tax=Aeromonas veronii TaxID=654 RepID=UPI00403D8B8C